MVDKRSYRERKRSADEWASLDDYKDIDMDAFRWVMWNAFLVDWEKGIPPCSRTIKPVQAWEKQLESRWRGYPPEEREKALERMLSFWEAAPLAGLLEDLGEYPRGMVILAMHRLMGDAPRELDWSYGYGAAISWARSRSPGASSVMNVHYAGSRSRPGGEPSVLRDRGERPWMGLPGDRGPLGLGPTTAVDGSACALTMR